MIDDEWDDDFEIEISENNDIADEESNNKKTRLDRLRSKIKKLRGKDPDIYPMW